MDNENAAAEAPAEIVEALSPAPEGQTADDAPESPDMGAVWDKLTADGIEEEEEPKDEAAPVEEDAQDEGEKSDKEPEEAKGEAKSDAPGDLPAKIREHWASMPEAAREAIASSQREMSNKLAEQGRVVHAARPVYDVLVRAAREMPSIQGMTPEAIAGDVFKMAKFQDQLANDPVQTIAGVAKQYGAIDGLRELLGGGEQSQNSQAMTDLVAENRRLSREIERIGDPAAIEAQIERSMTQRDVQRAVREFSADKPHWGDVEQQMPQFIGIAKTTLGESASAQDVLDQAYDMAIHADPKLREKISAAAAPVAPTPDPARTQAQLNAKSVNVRSTATGKFREMTEAEQMGAVWDKHAS